jgi:hypothetical protein
VALGFWLACLSIAHPALAQTPTAVFADLTAALGSAATGDGAGSTDIDQDGRVDSDLLWPNNHS